MSMELNLKLSGNTFKYVGFFHSGGNHIIRGWWEHADGSEGGYLRINTATADIEDFDGAGDLPSYVREELLVLGITCHWD